MCQNITFLNMFRIRAIAQVQHLYGPILARIAILNLYNVLKREKFSVLLISENLFFSYPEVGHRGIRYVYFSRT